MSQTEARSASEGTAHPRTGWFLPAEGRTWFLTTALLLAIGIFKNISLLILLASVLLAVLLVNVPAAYWRLRGLVGRRRLADFPVAGEPSLVKVTVLRTSKQTDQRPAARQQPAADKRPAGRTGVWIEDHAPGRTRSWPWQARAGQPEQTWQGPVVLPRRGRHVWGPLIATSGYPFGLLWRRVVLVEAQEVTVLPRLGRVQRGQLRRYLRAGDPRADRVRRHALRHRAAQAEFHGLREFRTGDSPRWIHWRTSARSGMLMVREFEDLPGDDLVIVLDAGSYLPGAAAEEFERAVSLAASLCWEWCRHKSDRLVLGVAGVRPDVIAGLTGPELALTILQCLALVEPAGTTAGNLIDHLAAVTPPSASVLLLAHGPSTLPDALRRRLERPITVIDTQAINRLEFYTPPSNG
jgi:uncharacterized protein (DUF58 family)